MISPSANANTLLQSILGGIYFGAAGHASSSSSTGRSPSSSTQGTTAPAVTKDRSAVPSANGSSQYSGDSARLLGLLSGAVPSSSTKQASTAQDLKPPTPSLPRDDVSSEASSASVTPAVPIPRPSVPPTSVFSFTSPFDELLDKDSPLRQNPPTVREAKHTQPAEEGADGPRKKARQTPRSSISTLEPVVKTEVSTSSASTVERASSASADAIAPEVSQESEEPSIDHASQHLAKLLVNKDFKSGATSGRTIDAVSPYTTVFKLDLRSAQPAGPSSLYPAKLEVSPVAKTSSPSSDRFDVVYDRLGLDGKPLESSAVVGQFEQPTIASLGSDILAYRLKKGKIRVLNLIDGERLVLQTPQSVPVRSVWASRVASSAPGTQEWWVVASTEAGLEGCDALCCWSISREVATDGQQTEMKSLFLGSILFRALQPQRPRLSSFYWSQEPEATSCTLIVQADEPGGQDQGVVCRVQNLRDYFDGSAGEDKQVRVDEGTFSAIGSVFESEGHLVASTFSADGSVVAYLEAPLRPTAGRAFDLKLQPRKDSGHDWTIHLFVPAIPWQVYSEARLPVSYLQLLSDSGPSACPRGALIGFDRNSIIGLFDVEQSLWRAVWKFDVAPLRVQNILRWQQPASTLLIANGSRASIFALTLRFSPLPSIKSDEATTEAQNLRERLPRDPQEPKNLSWSIRVPVALQEVALPKASGSFDLAEGVRGQPFAIRSMSDTIDSIAMPDLSDRWEEHVLVTPRPEIAQAEPAKTETKPTPRESAPIKVTAPARVATPVSASTGTEQASAAPVTAASSVTSSPRLSSNDPRPTPTKRPARSKKAKAAAKEETAALLASQSPVKPEAQTAAPVTAAEHSRPDSPIKAASRKATNGVHAEHVHEPIEQAKDLQDATPTPSSATAGGVDLSDLFQKLELNLTDKLSQMNPSRPPINLPAAAPQLSPDAIGVIGSRLADQLGPHLVRAVVPQIASTVQSAVQEQFRTGIVDSLKHALPAELHSLITRQDITALMTRSISNGIVPVVQRTSMDVVTRVLAPHFEEHLGDLVQQLERRVEGTFTEMKKSLEVEQSAALRQTQDTLSQVTASLGIMVTQLDALTDQNAKLQRQLNENIQRQQRAEALSAAATPVAMPPPSLPSGPAFPSGNFPPMTPSYRHPSGNWNPVEPFNPPAAQMNGGQALMQQRQQMPYNLWSGFPPASAPSALGNFNQQQNFNQQPVPSLAQLEAAVANFPQQGPVESNVRSESAPSAAPSNPTSAQPNENQPSAEEALLEALSVTAGVDARLAAVLDRLSLQGRVRPEDVLYQPGPISPARGGVRKMAVSQAIVLALLHRLITTCLRPSMFPLYPLERIVPWIEACAAALNPRDETIRDAYQHTRGPIRSSVQARHKECQEQIGAAASWWTKERLQDRVLRFLP